MDMGDIDKRSKGGRARAEKLSPEERSEIARKGAEGRWRADIQTVVCAGELKLGNVSIPCYVTEQGQRLISGRAMQDALRVVDNVPGKAERAGSRLTRLLNNKKLKPLIYKEKSADHFLPVRARWQGTVINGHDGEMLVDICEGMLEGRVQGKLNTPRQAIIAAQCELIMRGLAKTGIVALIDEATGYQHLRPADGLRTYFNQILRRDLVAWFKRFPDEFYENIYRLKDWTWPGMQKNRYSVVAHYTNDLIYERMVPGLKEEFDRRNPKDARGYRKIKNQQLLNDDLGDKLFSQQMFTVIALQRACINKTGNKWAQFKKMMDDVLPKRGSTIPLPFADVTDDDSSEPEPPSAQSPSAS